MTFLKTDINPMPQFFDQYINQVPEENIFTALEASKKVLDELDIENLKEIGKKTYAPNKWTVHEIFQHIIDNERIQAYRALRIARKDETVLPGYDENVLAAHSFADDRHLDDIIEELKMVRTSNIALFKSINPVLLTHNGICFKQKISALALGFVIVGHQIHHLQVIKEKYEPLIFL